MEAERNVTCPGSFYRNAPGWEGTWVSQFFQQGYWDASKVLQLLKQCEKAEKGKRGMEKQKYKRTGRRERKRGKVQGEERGEGSSTSAYNLNAISCHGWVVYFVCSSVFSKV